MRVTIVGSGDAFGSGGRLNTCFHVAHSGGSFLVDCGASSLLALKRCNIDRNAIRTILLTHFHADHVGGIPFFILDAQLISKRTEPLTIVGPKGLLDWYPRAMEAAFAGSSTVKRAFEVELIEFDPIAPMAINGLHVTPASVRHGQPEGAFLAYRIECDGRILAYSSDTEWTDALVPIGRDADLFIAECYTYDRKLPLHLDYLTLAANMTRIAPKRILLTHMSEEMLAVAERVPEEKAEDGKVIHL
jgi:ribonuclease BN (tRNA processing enzyme)